MTISRTYYSLLFDTLFQVSPDLVFPSISPSNMLIATRSIRDPMRLELEMPLHIASFY